MRLPRMTTRRWMKAVVVAAVILTPFAWLSRESRAPFHVTTLTVGLLLLVFASPFLFDWLCRDEMLGPRARERTAQQVEAGPPAEP